MIWAILIVLIALAIAATAVIFNMAFARRAIKLPLPGGDGSLWAPYADQIAEGEKWFAEQEKDDAWMTARDKKRLHAVYIPSEGSDKSIILCHGYRTRSAQFDFSCAMKLYHDMGYNLLLIDQRAHGRSEGSLTTFGVLEKGDIADWAKALDADKHPRVIVLDGMSMGAAAVLMALGEELPPSVKGAIADCGYTRATAMIADAMRRLFHLPAKIIMPGLKAAFRLHTGHDLSEADAPRALGKTKLPVLLVHGEADAFVPPRMGRENYAVCASPKKLVIVPGAGHGLSFLVDKKRVTREVSEFLRALDVQ